MPGCPSAPGTPQGIPEACDEGDLQQLLAGFPGVRAVRLVRNRAGEGGPQHKGYAFLDFDTQADVAVLMETKARCAGAAAAAAARPLGMPTAAGEMCAHALPTYALQLCLHSVSFHSV